MICKCITLAAIILINARVEAANRDWWQHAVFYQIYPRSFKDSNNDGIGDLQGIISKLGYLKKAGVNATWLSPIYKSPQVDQGYDISDYMTIEECYGTLSDFKQLVREAHDMGIKIIMDFVPNHSSNQHEWFEKSERRETPYENYYVWRDEVQNGPPNNWRSIFKYSAWTKSHVRGQYYLHQFSESQPDLNYREPGVVESMTAVLKFWLDLDVDGFRIDAAQYLVEDEDFLDEPSSGDSNISPQEHGSLKHIYTSDQPGTFDMIYKWRQFLDEYTEEHGGDVRVIMTEAYTDMENLMKYYGNETNEGAHFTFNFQLIKKINKDSSARDIAASVGEWLDHMPSRYTANWVIGNHDNHRVATKFGQERVDGMNMLTAFLPGVMVTYNGEEIGQEDGEVTWDQGQDPSACDGLEEDFASVSRDFERTPFHWNGSINAGFNEGRTPWLPVSQKYKCNNLALQSVPGIKSHYHIYQQLLKLRQRPEILKGSFKITALSDKVLAFTRADTYVILINMGDTEEVVDLAEMGILNQYIKVLVADTNSKNHDRVLSSKQLKLTAYEGIVAKMLPYVGQGDLNWWKHAVFYQIYPRSFKDSNNDGVGDLKGIINKLSHLKDTGVTAALLSPIYTSPQGYDISDFMEIDEDYGTLKEFVELLDAAHGMGIKIIMDLVPNHSSNKHEWFIKSENREPFYEDYYVWKDGKNGGPPNNWLSRFKSSAWEYSPKRHQYYYHEFMKEQPDLNYRNELVVQQMKNVLNFWLDIGVDGFRMDAVNYLFEDAEFRDEPLSNDPGATPGDNNYLNHVYTTDQAETYNMIYQWRNLVSDYAKEYGGDERIMMTEAYTDIKNTTAYYGDESHDGAHFSFNFHLITNLNKSSTAEDVAKTINEWLKHIPKKYTSNWVLGNHDNNRVATRFGPKRIDGMNTLIALLPGVMVTYNGEEIGQEDGEVTWEQGQDPIACNGRDDDFNKTSRDFERTPFHWDNSANAGFNAGHPPWLPVGQKYLETNLAAQKRVNTSHYNIYKKLLLLRKEPAFSKGSVNVQALSKNILGFTREIFGGTSYIVLSNIGANRETVNLFNFKAAKKNIEIISSTSNRKEKLLTTNRVDLDAYETLVAKILPDRNWWKHAVFYQIYPRSFKDSNNDGIGDLQGVISKLDHLVDAGITAACLSPIYKSPQVNQVFDISDFMDIHHEYGTLKDFDELLQKAHQLNVKIIMDFVPNHSSDKHQWFIDSENNVEGFEDFYVWKNGNQTHPPNNWISHFKYSAWTYSGKRNQWYLHQFAPQQPDLNYRNPKLKESMKRVLKFWLDKGVDGFRMEAVPYLIEDVHFQDEPVANNPNALPHDYEYLRHVYTSDQQGTYDIIYEWRDFIDQYNKNHKDPEPRVLISEAYTDIQHTMLYYGDGILNGAHFPLNFLFVTELNQKFTAQEILTTIKKWFNNMPHGGTPNWVLGNHDNHRVATRFGPERVDGMNIITSLLPGVMLIYNGEEIGQENGEVTFEQCQDPRGCNAGAKKFANVSRDFERTPFQWDSSTNAGFNAGAKTWLPVSSKYRQTNLATQSILGANSHYHIYKSLVKLRREEAFLNGTLNIAAINDNVLAFTRGNSYVAVVNIGNREENVDVSTLTMGKRFKVLVTNKKSRKHDNVLTPHGLTLSGYEILVARILPHTQEGNQNWWKHAVFYQIYPRSFKDSNNDGIGDLKGITSKLHHLNDSGITAAWLSPVYKSPQVDHGYDISDFMAIDESYGTLEDFDELLKQAHAMGIKIIMDFVPNHSSNQHEWFVRSENREPPYDDFYVWKDGINGNPPNNWLSIFKYSAWEYSPKRRQYYLHQFATAQPDLNFRNPILVQQMKGALKFWLDRGVDGFRMDAVPYLFEDAKFANEPLSNATGASLDEHISLQHIYTSDQKETFDMIYQWRNFLDDYSKEHGGDVRVMMTEAYTDIQNTMLYYGNATHQGAHFTFNFQLITKLSKISSAMDIVGAINEWLQNMPDKYTPNWVLGNHDHHRVATRLGSENVDGFNMLTALLPGVMVTYNGEEMGQEDGEVTWEEGKDPSAYNRPQEEFAKYSRDFERTPFQWDSTTNAGFNKGFKPWLPVSRKYRQTNLEAQTDPTKPTHYQIYKKLLELRKQNAFTEGSFKIEALSKDVLGYRRSMGSVSYFYIFNIGDRNQTIDVKTKFGSSTTSYLEVLISSGGSAKEVGTLLDAGEFVLGPNECVIAVSTSKGLNGATNASFILISLFLGLFLVLVIV